MPSPGSGPWAGCSTESAGDMAGTPPTVGNPTVEQIVSTLQTTERCHRLLNNAAIHKQGRLQEETEATRANPGFQTPLEARESLVDWQPVDWIEFEKATKQYALPLLPTPSSFICPITHERMSDPVLVRATGSTCDSVSLSSEFVSHDCKLKIKIQILQGRVMNGTPSRAGSSFILLIL